MSVADLARAAETFAARHRDGPILVLPNAFDVATARLIARHGPVAIGTTSAAISAILGYPDNEVIDRDEMLAAIDRMVRAVDIGISADVEAGYGDDVDDVRVVVERLLEIGVVGVNLQDTGHPGGRWAGGLLPVERASEKIAAARAAAERAGVPLVINARTDTFLEDGDPVASAIARGNAYLAVGATCVFTPGITDREGLAALVAGLDGPLNAYAVAGTPTVTELEAIGVRRVSVGCGPYQACLALVERATRQLLEDGRYSAFTEEQLTLSEMTALVE
jgi:2-methylisocitrate lyase-like PEP mutase family enzyme